MENRNAHSLQRQNELEQQLMSRSAPNDAVLPEPRPPPQKPRTDLDALFALTKRFCCVQIGNCFILLIAVPASIYCMILSMGILIGFLGSIKFVEVQCSNKSEREKRDVFGRHWLLLMHLWLPYAAMISVLYLAFPRCCGALTPSTRVVCRREGVGWSLCRFWGRSDGIGPRGR